MTTSSLYNPEFNDLFLQMIGLRNLANQGCSFSLGMDATWLAGHSNGKTFENAALVLAARAGRTESEQAEWEKETDDKYHDPRVLAKICLYHSSRDLSGPFRLGWSNKVVKCSDYQLASLASVFFPLREFYPQEADGYDALVCQVETYKTELAEFGTNLVYDGWFRQGLLNWRKARFMARSGSTLYAKNKDYGFQIVALETVETVGHMRSGHRVIILPDSRRGLGKIQKAICSGMLDSWVRDLRVKNVAVSLPIRDRENVYWVRGVDVTPMLGASWKKINPVGRMLNYICCADHVGPQANLEDGDVFEGCEIRFEVNRPSVDMFVSGGRVITYNIG